MIGRQDRRQQEMFVPGNLEALVPDDHILKRVDRVLDLSWLREEVAPCYCADNGRPGIDPEAAVRLMLAGFFEGIVHDRKLMRQAQVNIAMRWFAGYNFEDTLPHHSSLTRIRQRWGAERFRRIFTRTVEACAAAGLVRGDTVHVDATLIRADVSWESLSDDWAEATLRENHSDDDKEPPPAAGKKRAARPRKKKKKPKKRSSTDPDATLTTSKKGFLMEPSYKQHTAVDDAAGVIVDVAVTTGEASEGERLMQTIARVQETTHSKVERVTADGAYAHSANYAACEEREIDAVIPPQRAPRPKRPLPASRFKYDAKNKVVHCPAGQKLTRNSPAKKGCLFRGEARTCGRCRLRTSCISPSAKVRTIIIVHGYEALLRARRRRALWDEATVNWYKRHRWRVEGVHGEAKTQHGLRRAARRGLPNVAIQAYLTAAAINLKRLAACFLPLRRLLNAAVGTFNVFSYPDRFLFKFSLANRCLIFAVA